MRSQKARATVASESGSAKRTRKSAERAPTEITHDEVLIRYPGQWVLMRVTEWDRDAYPARGYLVAHSPSRAEIDKARLEAIRARDSRPGVLAAFEAHPPIRSQEEWIAALKRLAEEWEGDPLDLCPSG